MQFSNKLFIVISIALLCIVSVPSALAYFYTYAQTEGTVTVSLSDKSDIVERIEKGEKIVQIKADNNSDPVFVRVKYVAPSNATITVVQNEGWVLDGDFYYFSKPIDGKGDDSESDVIKSLTDTTLNIKIERPADMEEGETFDVVVLHEMTPALFSESEPSATYKFFDSEKNGWWYADWTTTVKPTTEVDG